jgi:hypothetical protein
MSKWAGEWMTYVGFHAGADFGGFCCAAFVFVEAEVEGSACCCETEDDIDVFHGE